MFYLGCRFGVRKVLEKEVAKLKAQRQILADFADKVDESEDLSKLADTIQKMLDNDEK